MTATGDPQAAAPGWTALVLYDGDCGLCTYVAGALSRKTGPAVAWRAWQREPVLPPEVTAARLERELVLVDSGGRTRGGADAFRAVFHNARGLRWIAIVMGVPGITALCRGGYALAARNRRRLSRLMGFRSCALQPRR